MDTLPELVSTGRKKARIEIIPLIDVVFFLLATFVLFTLSLEKLGMYELPRPQGEIDPKSDRATAYVQASSHDTFFWKEGRDGLSEPVHGTELRSRLVDFQQRVPGGKVFANGDAGAKYGSTLKVIDHCKVLGIEAAIETVRR